MFFLNYNFYDLLFYFFIYAFLGWCIEITYSIIKNHKFINRGFLHGPFCPMYGIGALIILFFLEPIKNNLIFLFLISIIITSTLEYFTGYILEKCFNTTWWNYSNDIFNIKGRICIKFSLIWGVFSIFFIKLIHPYLTTKFNLIHIKYKLLFIYILCIYFLIDFILTLNSLHKLNILLKQLNDINLELKNKIKNIKGTATEKSKNIEKIYKELKNKYDYIYNKIHTNYSRFLQAFPKFTLNKIDKIKNKFSSLKH